MSPLPDEPPPEPGGRYSVTVNKPRRGRDRGEWRLRIARPDGTDTHELSGVPWCPSTLGQAEHQARIREAELNGETPPPSQPDGLTFGQVLERYVAWSEEHQAEGTAEVNRKALLHAQACGIAEVAADRLTRRDMSDALDHLFRQLKGNTASGYHRRWKQAWAWAREKELVDEPLPVVRRRRLGAADRTQKRALTDDEAVDLLSYATRYAGGRYRLVLWALAETGARIGELGRLRIEDVSWRGPGHAARLRFKQKGGSDRYNWVSPPLAQALSDEAIGSRTSGPIWRSARGGAVTCSTLQPLMASWRDKRGLQGQVDTHSLRRYAVARLERAGVSRAAGQKVTGHSSAAIYANYAAKGLYDALAANSALWVDRVSTASMDGARLGDGDQPGAVLTQESRGPVYIADLTPAIQLRGEGRPCCPLLIGFLESREGRLKAAREALRRSLQAVRA